ncbi:protein phosphatase 2C domain-containing protein [Prosthecobacter sp.]|uniref:protein phosphatase 2C domain-containing protein n=1 Tax=Prosthecobacter sp. TaxID=1965333 RepID=UPI00378518B1
MTLHSNTEPGGKPTNEDYLIARRHPSASDTLICLLADGQGGQSNGALAARTACESAWIHALHRPAHSLFEDGTWPDILQQADHETSLTGGFTTLIALAVTKDFVAGASSGDSKVFFKHRSRSDLHEWTAHQHKNPPVGSQSADFVPFMCHAVGGGRILMLSDGAWKYCGYDALTQSFDLSASSVPDHLRNAILSRSGPTLPDDFSIITVDID